MSYRDFEAARREAKRETHTFSLRGEKFECVPMVAAADLFDLGARGLAAIPSRAFIDACLVDNDTRDRFAELLADRSDPVEIDELAAVAGWLVEVYVGRPILRSDDSSAGPSPGGRGSTDVPLDPAAAS